ncbi:MAG TPA: TIM-barrel domain-containing protein [Terracidiphilus sp.]|nr:TIM-barrel domain-containing protein [Terracidiphilus sp.]
MKAVGLTLLIIFGGSIVYGATQRTATTDIRQAGPSVWVASSGYFEVRIEASPTPSLTIYKRINGQNKKIAKFPLLADLAFKTSGEELTGKASLINGRVEKAQRGGTLVFKYALASGGQQTLQLHFFDRYFTYQSSWQIADSAGRPYWIKYFAQTDSDATSDSSFSVENDEISTWTPDLYRAFIPEHGLSRVILSTHASSGPDSYLRGFGAGSPLVPPYIASLRAGSEWWGIGTVALPDTADGLDLTVGRDQFGISFGAGQVPARQSKIEGPIVGVYFGDQPESILSQYFSSLKSEEGDPVSEQSKLWHTWWSEPIYCTWGEQAYAARIAEGTLQEDHGGRYITDANLSKWINLAKQQHLPFGTVIIDLGWMLDYGDFEPNPARFANLRKTIDHLHSEGLHVLLWIPMYEATGSLFSPDKTVSDVATKHPDWLIKSRSGHTTDVFDFTNPAVRAYVKERIHYLLTSEANGLNADGLKVDFMDRVPDPAESDFYDASWGVGELMQARVLSLFYSSAKEAKSDALIDSSFMNPLFKNWQDIVRLNDDVSNSIATYWWRAWAASLNEVPAIDGDDWWAMKRYFVPLTLAKAAWGIPNVYAIEYRGELGTQGPIGGISSIASGGYPVSISDSDYRRVSAILQVYRHAPASNAQRVSVSPNLREASRTYSNGPMAGQLAATTLNHGFALATYDRSSVWVTSVSDDELVVPIPKGAHIARVFVVGFDGKRQVVQFQIEANGDVRIRAQDSAEGSAYYAIDYGEQRHAQ